MQTDRRVRWDEAELRALAAQGMTCAEMAAELGRPEEALRRAMVRRGIPRLAAKARPEKNAFWRGGFHVDKHGYILVRRPLHPAVDAHGYVRQHRLVAEATLGRLLTATEVVDHRDGDTSWNHPTNLRVFPTNAAHLAATVTGTQNVSAEERERRTLEAVRRARQRVDAILSGSGTYAGPLPSLGSR